MYQGFYNLASGMLTQSRTLNVISNNMVNLQTAGYKQDKMVSTTFQEEMLYRTGRYNGNTRTDLATVSKIRTALRTYVNYEQGNFEPTEGIYDFALSGRGFFCVQTPNGIQYTRNGSFAIDAEGYLVLGENGRVLSTENQPIRIANENFYVDSQGRIALAQASGDVEAMEFGTLRIVDFNDYEQLHKEDNGLFSTNQAPIAVNQGETQVLWKTLERSNVDMIDEMTSMMTAQRALQSSAQMLQMYDQIMTKSASDIGKI